jgi:3-phosphoshikimate 1-carboxyvinyltransferase
VAPKILRGPFSDLSACVAVPPSKSLTNRALVAAAVAGGGEIRNPLDCEDTRLLAQALKAAGWEVTWTESISVGPRRVPDGVPHLWLGNSGTGARLLLGLLAASPGRVLLDGTERLRQRPMQPLLDAVGRLGGRVSSADGRLPVEIEGALLNGGRVSIRPEVSSQFVSSLLLAAPLMRLGIDLEVEGELPSRPYVDLTVDVLLEFGVEVHLNADSRRVQVAPGAVRHATLVVEGDWSAAAFMAAAAAVGGGEVAVHPLSATSRQGDRAVVHILMRSGVDAVVEKTGFRFRGPARGPLTADLTDTPDLFPALAVVAATLPPGSRLSGLAHLKHKESDRLSVMIDNLERLGCRFEWEGSVVRVSRGLQRAENLVRSVTAADDHRIAMAMAVAALVAGPLELDDPTCVVKSFPGFWETWESVLPREDEGRPP